MKNSRVFKLIIPYLRMRLGIIIFLSLFSIIFAMILSLYNLPQEPIAYAAVLYINIGIIFIAVDFSRFFRHHELLQELKTNIAIELDRLPEPRNLIERDYQDIISTAYEMNLKIANKAEISRSNMMDYYTLWAHQIKTPIAAMRLLLQGEESEQNSELSMELFKIEQYVEFVLQYLRVESMTSDLMLKKYSLDDIVKQAVRKYARMFIRKKIKLNFEPLNCEVLTDEKWLVFVIEQILSNALKYTKEGSISIYMDKNAEKTLVIEDTGIGIKEEDLNRIFERGFTGYNGRWDKKSTGLGLYLCRQILGKLSHTISIESQVDKGTKVLIDLSTVELGVE